RRARPRVPRRQRPRQQRASLFDTLARTMIDVDAGRFTVGVFQDAAWAQKGLDALKRAGFPAESISIIAKEGAEASALVQRTLGSAGDRMELPAIGAAVARGPLVDALQGGDKGLGTVGIARTMRRVGFQPHDGRIFET